MSRRPVLLALALTLAIAAPATAQPRPSTPPGGPPESGTSSRARPHEVSGPNEEKVAQTSHVMRLDGRELKYTATAATVPIRLDDGEIAARMFFVAYTKDGEDVGRRPISFLFNGGPGSASVWLHMGSYGPKIAKMADEGFQPPPPYELVDNPYSLLDVSDLVFVDAIDTGYSRVMPGVDNRQFHGQDGDIRAFGEFVAEYLRVYDRYPSPKFLIGESYGTTRASGLAGYLQSQHQMYLNGVVLVSMTNLGVERGVDVNYATALPYMTATAWYHKTLAADLQARPLRDVLTEAEAFAMRDYLFALTKGSLIGAEEKAATAKAVARLTGVSADFVLRSNLRVEKSRFWKELLRNRGITVGRLDSRYTGRDRDNAGEAYEGDAALWNWDGPFAAALQIYFKDELKWETDEKYYVWGNVRPWRQDPDPRVGEMLRRAMNQNPYLEVLVLQGYYDGGTDYYSAQYTIAHLDPGGSLNSRFHFAFYESGHMMYLKQSELAKTKQDLVKFIQLGSGQNPRDPASK